jgi:hypothetical protein
MKTQTRYKFTLAAAIYFGLITLVAIYFQMETVATACIAAIMTILSTYIWSQTTRPTFEDDEKNTITIKPAKNPRYGNSYPGPMDILEKQ